MFRILFGIGLILMPAAAQEIGGGISGRVQDPSGSAVPGASLVAMHVETGTVRRTVANHEGVYAFPNLPIGNYELTATHDGFKKAVLRGIELHVSDRLDVNISLELGAVTAEVSVSDTAEKVQTDSADQGALISGEQVRE